MRALQRLNHFSSPWHQTNSTCLPGKKLTDDCKKELADFKRDLGTNINKNIPLGKHTGL